MGSVIQADDLCFRYAANGPNVLDRVNVRIGKGEYVSIVGENGSGKSTLVRLMLGLMKPTSGTMTRSSRLTGYVPQKKDFLGSQFPITVRETLDSYRAILGLKGKDTVRKSLERVRMEEFRDALIGTLSGGQAQRVLIARALIGSPDLIVLDEPSSGVDMKSQKEIYSIIRDLCREDGITIVSVEHNLDAAIMNSTLIYHLADGHGHMCDTETYAAEFLRATREIAHA
jgi:zinc transport system ATP-binding protein